MDHKSQQKRTFIYIGIALLALVLLAASLSSVTLDPGSPMPVFNIAPDVVDEEIPVGWTRFLMAALRVMLIIGWLVLPFYVIYLIISKEARKRFLRDILALLPFLIILYFLSMNSTGRGFIQEIAPGIGQEGLEAMELEPGEAMPEFSEPPAWVTTVTSLILAAALSLMVAGLVFVFLRRSRRRTLEPLRRVEREAQAALDAIEAGGDLRDVIIRCYVQMLQALSEYRNIQRASDVTPHEFEEFLLQRGLPGGPIHQLTSLFEQVRYGGVRPGRQEERAAVASLSAIVSACQRSRAQETGA